MQLFIIIFSTGDINGLMSIEIADYEIYIIRYQLIYFEIPLKITPIRQGQTILF